MMNEQWEDADATCPKCKCKTEMLRESGSDGYRYDKAERCPRCRWIVDFEADEIKAVRY